MMCFQVGINYKALDQSDNTHIAELGKKHLQYLPKNSIVISQVRIFFSGSNIPLYNVNIPKTPSLCATLRGVLV